MKKSGGFFLCLLINLFANIFWAIPSVVLLILHYACDISIAWFWGTLGAWLLLVLFMTFIINHAVKCSDIPDAKKENKNPYSSKNSDFPTNKN